jgi:hypothetical protein
MNGYSTTTQAGLTDGFLAPQALQLIDCSFPSGQIENEMNPTTKPNCKPLFPPSTSIQDYMVSEGEVCFSLSNPIERAGNIPARTALNGLVVKGSTSSEQLAYFYDNLVIIGLAHKTCTVNDRVLSHTENPVAAVGGSMTILNVTKYDYRTGDILIATVPSFTRGSSQAPKDGSMEITAYRRVLEQVPLRCIVTPLIKGTMKPDEFEQIMPHKKMVSIIKSKVFRDMLRTVFYHAYALGHLSTKADPEKYIKSLKDGPDDFHKSKKAQYDTATYTDIDTVITDAMVETNVDKIMKVLDKLDEHSFLPAYDLIRSMMGIGMITASTLYSRQTARVIRGSTPGTTSDVSIRLGNYNIGPFVNF